MKKVFTSAIVLTLASAGLAQTEAVPARSPEEVLRKFVKLELEGARLTPESRQNLAHFLVHPSSALPYPINVVSDDFDVSEIPSPQNNPKLNVYFRYFYGNLDSAVRFFASLHGNSLLREGTNVEYVLTLTDTQGVQTKQVAAAQEWKVEDAHPYCFITLATAIRYVTVMRDKATDPAIKKNADETLAKLKKLH